MDKSKRSIVKHRTNSGGPSRRSNDKKKGGFRSVGANLPDGAYLGKAKKLKANLIQNAKIKSKFYKQRGEGSSISSASASHSTSDTQSNPLGRFAREGGEDEDQDAFSKKRRRHDDGYDERRTSRAGPAPDESEIDNTRRRNRAGPISDDEGDNSRRRRDRAGPPQDDKGDSQSRRRRDRAGPAPTSDNAPAPQPPRKRYASREEAMEARSKRNEKWTQTSRSVQGAKRRQPDLGARMEVLLDKIQTEQ